MTVPTPTAPTNAQFDALLRSDFRFFLRKAFQTLNPGQTFKPNWHHDVVAWELMEVMGGRCLRLNINMPPRYLKSLMVSVAFPAFVLGHNPAVRFICVSYSQELANKLSRDCRTLIQSPWYRRAFPGTMLSSERNTEHDFKTTAHGGRFATSVGGTLTGMGADIIILDDILKAQDGASERACQEAIAWYSGSAVTRLNDKQTGAIINVAQRLNPDDPSGCFIAMGGWKSLVLPAIARERETFPLIGGSVHERKVGELLHPEQEPAEVLEHLRRDLGSRDFEAQYQQDPLPLDGEILKWDWFRIYEPIAFGGGVPCEVVQSWDTANAGNSDNDWSVCTTWNVVGSCYYLIDVFRGRLLYPDLKRKIAELKKLYSCDCVLIENKGSGQSLIQDLPEIGVFPIAINPVGDKVERLAASTVPVESGRVFLPREAPWLSAFKAELLRFPRGRYDDQVDSLSQFLAYMRERAMRTVTRRSF